MSAGKKVIYFVFEMKEDGTGDFIYPDEPSIESEVFLCIEGENHQFPIIEKKMLEVGVGKITTMEFLYDGIHVSYRFVVLGEREASKKEVENGVNWNLENKIKSSLKKSEQYKEWLDRDFVREEE